MRWLLSGLLLFCSFSLPAFEIQSVTPGVVQPGSLVTIAGSDFGTTPKPFLVGDLKVDHFVTWSPTVIRFRYPGKTRPSGPVLIDLPSPQPFNLAPSAEGSLLVRFRIDPAAVQRLLDKDPRSTLQGPPFPFLPLFELVDEVSGARALPFADSTGLWQAEWLVPPPDDPRLLRMVSVVPLAKAGSEARRALAVFAELWAQADVWKLVRGAPAWAWADRDPRYNAADASITLSFPVQP